MFYIEDDLHADSWGGFATLQRTLDELARLAGLPWDQDPNLAPCIGWEKCGRRYELVEYDETQTPWNELRRIRVLEVSAQQVVWVTDPGAVTLKWS